MKNNSSLRFAPIHLVSTVLLIVCMALSFPGFSKVAEVKHNYLCLTLAKDPEHADVVTVTAVNDILNAFPLDLLEGMVDNGWRIYLTSGNDWLVDLRNKYTNIPADNYKAGTYYFLAAYLENQNGAWMEWKSRDEEFNKDVYMPESGIFYCRFENLYSEYEYAKREDYLANALYAYALHNRDLKQFCPKTWQFVADLISGSTEKSC